MPSLMVICVLLCSLPVILFFLLSPTSLLTTLSLPSFSFPPVLFSLFPLFLILFPFLIPSPPSSYDISSLFPFPPTYYHGVISSFYKCLHTYSLLDLTSFLFSISPCSFCLRNTATLTPGDDSSKNSLSC